MKHIITTAALSASLVLLAAAATAQDGNFRWSDSFGQGISDASVDNANGARFTLNCAAGMVDKVAGVSVEAPAMGQNYLKETVPFEVVVGAERFAFAMVQGTAKAADAATKDKIRRLAAALASSRATAFTVELPRHKDTERFSLRDARRVIGAGKASMMAPCL